MYGVVFYRFVTYSFMEFKRKLIGERFNKLYNVVVTVSLLSYKAVFRTSFTSHYKCVT